MRWLIGVMALAALGCSDAEVVCTAVLRQAVFVELLNADTDRRISGATVSVSDGVDSIELMELVRGQYGLWNDVPGFTVTATHADYYDATSTLTRTGGECAYQQAATIRMTRKTPCARGVAGVRVEISDDDGVAIGGASIDLRDGTYSERMTDMGGGRYEGAYDRAGIYRIEAMAAGYSAQIVESIWVEEDDCTVLTNELSLVLPKAGR